MAEGCSLPVPARGDIYTHDGGLKITNAAANIFVVYDRQHQDGSRSPSSLSVDFVMGNVYLIDSTYFTPFKWGNTRLFGNLIKGLGLDIEGCRRGDTYVKTVYDDVVCVVGNERGAACSIGAVAGNLVTVLDLSQVLGHPKPQNVTISYIHGLKLYESYLAYGGGLHRAYSTWASMTFSATSRTSPIQLSESRVIDSGRLSSSADNSAMAEQHLTSDQHNQTHPPDRLNDVTTSQGETSQEIKNAKRQIDAIAQVIDLRKSVLHLLDKDFDLADHSNSRHFSAGTPISCANCKRTGHEVQDCIGPVDADGFIAACSLCNKNDHIYDQCCLRMNLKASQKNAMNFEYLVLRRQNKAPIKSNICWIVAWARCECPRIILPHTRAFALELSNCKTATAPYPDWRTYSYPASADEVRAERGLLLRDPATVYEGGEGCYLSPGSQCSRFISDFCAVKKRMEQLGVKFHPELSKDANNKPKKRKKKKIANNKTDENPFATGANCTVLQRPLPPAPPARSVASVKIKQEHED
ncbi:hypothetical protein CGRA01v4_02652 [Colletotrichum graminicola]|uniref:CCHC-type domain-containing protein n=1 Tax=Colletotrichum graminicola (strain M1.001 / M2 / FGSC 10212) TaxID=645133 RepID=E3Q471_COLGM|nr:uncharacterized protein GLRG_00527 [Colletotrichum graminicola M1.001]EFQ25383.1 hypothetical protein GLRG_00527 [Colletotrichum graminicola M1.001]WDK11373.1 hypothetical protein CGRA01v4_02652 [Colletotrichum graminicola]